MKRKAFKILMVLTVFTLLGIPIRVSATPGQWSANGGIIYYNESSGKVGIGTALPLSSLQVSSKTAINQGTSSSSGYTWSTFGANSYFDGAWQRIDNTKGGAVVYMSGDPTSDQINFQVTDSNGNSKRMASYGTDYLILRESNLWIDKANNASSIIGASGNIILRMDRDGNSSSNHVSVQDYTGGYLLQVKDTGEVFIPGTLKAGQILFII